MTVTLGIYMHFLMEMVIKGVYFKNLTSDTLAPLCNFVIDIISHAHFLHTFYELSSLWYKHFMSGVWCQIKSYGKCSTGHL